jgi:hypothetical protein
MPTPFRSPYNSWGGGSHSVLVCDMSQLGTHVVAVLFVYSGLVQAQGGATGAMSGTMQDSSGAVVQGATLTIVNTGAGETIRAVRTNCQSRAAVGLHLQAISDREVGLSSRARHTAGRFVNSSGGGPLSFRSDRCYVEHKLGPAL